MPSLPVIGVAVGVFALLTLLVFAFSGPSADKAKSRRLTALKDRHASSSATTIEAQLRRAVANRRSQAMEAVASRFIPNPAQLAKRLEMTGKDWKLSQYLMANAGVALVVALLLAIRGFPLPLAIILGLFAGLGLPFFVVNFLIKRRVAKFNSRFPEAIELLVRGLRSGLPVSETLSVVSSEIPGPVGEEFRMVTDKMRIGKSMELALQDTADRLGTPEFQFFVITLAIQRETGGNLAETLSNLADVLRKRMQMKLKIKAMSSESKASAYIVGSLPFIVFALIYTISDNYMQNFFIGDPAGPLGLSTLQIVGLGGLCWMGIGAFIMAQMVNFEI